MKIVSSHPLSGPPPEDLASARQRIRELEDSLVDAEQELAAAASIIEEQDCEIEDLKFRLEGADLVLDLEAETRRTLERRLAEVEKVATSLGGPRPVVETVPNQRASLSKRDYPPGYRSNPVVEAMIAAYRATEKK